MTEPVRMSSGALTQTRAVPHRRGAGLTVIEVLVAIVAVVTILFVVIVLMGGPGHSGRAAARQIKCATQVRSTVQAMTIFAQSNNDSYPLPSVLDTADQTVKETGRAKDTTNNTLSVLVFNSLVPPELLYCPSESNSSIKADAAYQHASPAAAANPAKALWDPGLRCDFTTGDAHISYAMLMPNGDTGAPKGDKARARLRRWSNSLNAQEVVYGNRGPLISGTRDSLGNPEYNKFSNTLSIHGKRTTWEGNIGYNDNHVAFETAMDPKPVTYLTADGKSKADILFYDEPDNADGLNAYLGIWVKAGVKTSEFKGIHD